MAVKGSDLVAPIKENCSNGHEENTLTRKTLGEAFGDPKEMTSQTSVPANASQTSSNGIYGSTFPKPEDGEATRPTLQKSDASGIDACISRKKAFTGNGELRESCYLGLLNEESHSTEYYKLYHESQLGFDEISEECPRESVWFLLRSKNGD